MKKHEKVQWLITAGLVEEMNTDDLLTEIAIFMDDGEFDTFYERLLNRFDWLGPKEFDDMCCNELDSKSVMTISIGRYDVGDLVDYNGFHCVVHEVSYNQKHEEYMYTLLECEDGTDKPKVSGFTFWPRYHEITEDNLCSRDL